MSSSLEYARVAHNIRQTLDGTGSSISYRGLDPGKRLRTRGHGTTEHLVPSASERAHNDNGHHAQHLPTVAAERSVSLAIRAFAKLLQTIQEKKTTISRFLKIAREDHSQQERKPVVEKGTLAQPKPRFILANPVYEKSIVPRYDSIRYVPYSAFGIVAAFTQFHIERVHESSLKKSAPGLGKSPTKNHRVDRSTDPDAHRDGHEQVLGLGQNEGVLTQHLSSPGLKSAPVTLRRSPRLKCQLRSEDGGDKVPRKPIAASVDSKSLSDRSATTQPMPGPSSRKNKRTHEQDEQEGVDVVTPSRKKRRVSEPEPIQPAHTSSARGKKRVRDHEDQEDASPRPKKKTHLSDPGQSNSSVSRVVERVAACPPSSTAPVPLVLGAHFLPPKEAMVGCKRPTERRLARSLLLLEYRMNARLDKTVRPL
ncbi:hypothetical protein D9613_009333 [Agrocybe pediades]|uniref:Uncharacterized protein n=1 Tax=Agrocybe pediades TaxID=84607 RepID=A0A8H4VWH6_9AGAR|nr:hypothetical protein D9613_009333 [Agrocybe pediades]